MASSTLRDNSTRVTQWLCAIVFCIFAFSWLYFFQADVIAVTQHVLSGGATTYNRLAGAVIILLIALLMQLAIAAVTRQHRFTHALTYFPSFALIALISSSPTKLLEGQVCVSTTWTVVTAILSLLWIIVMSVAHRSLPLFTSRMPQGLFSIQTTVSMVLLVAQMFYVAATANTHAVVHYRAAAEVHLRQGDVESALAVGQSSLESDPSLTMLRAYALSCNGHLGDALFDYPVCGSGADLLPLQLSASRLLILPADSLWAHLGVYPAIPLSTERYFTVCNSRLHSRRDSLTAHYAAELAEARSIEAEELDSLIADSVRHVSQTDRQLRVLADYRLCSYLIDRRLDRFAQELPTHYVIGDSLPRHYREALIVYRHTCSEPKVVYMNTILDEDWRDLQQLLAMQSQSNDRQLQLLSKYQGSYWHYYYSK